VATPAKSEPKAVAQNRRASHDYFLGERVEAGLVLTGTEVKSLREGKASLAEAWVRLDENGEAWLVQAHIQEYSHAGTLAQHDPTRKRKLLLHRRELDLLGKEMAVKGATLVPTKLYFKDGYAKVEIAVGTGKAGHDKRQAIASRDAKRDIDRAIKARRR